MIVSWGEERQFLSPTSQEAQVGECAALSTHVFIKFLFGLFWISSSQLFLGLAEERSVDVTVLFLDHVASYLHFFPFWLISANGTFFPAIVLTQLSNHSHLTLYDCTWDWWCIQGWGENLLRSILWLPGTKQRAEESCSAPWGTWLLQPQMPQSPVLLQLPFSEWSQSALVSHQYFTCHYGLGCIIWAALQALLAMWLPMAASNKTVCLLASIYEHGSYCAAG